MSNFNSFQFAKLVLVFYILVPTTSLALLDHDFLFLQCLDLHSNPKHPTSQVTYSQHNSSFQSILNAYGRNIRFLRSTTRKPSFIVAPEHVSNVPATIHCCKIHGFEMRIRGGGHDMEGLSFTSSVPFVILDLFNLRAIDVNLEKETAWIEGGAQLGEVYYRIAEKSPVHAFPGGVCPTVGVGGHFTGGGYGNLARTYGLSSDNVMDAVVVDARGRVLDRQAMGEDLFWAIRGGGAASFAVVLAFKVRIVRVPTVVTVFQVERTLEENVSRTMYQWQEVALKLPKELFLRARVSVIKDQGTGQNRLSFTFVAMYLGRSKQLVDLLGNNFPELNMSTKDCIEMSWINSTLFWNDLPLGTPTEVLLSRESEKLARKVKSDYVKNPIPEAVLDSLWKILLEMDGLVMEWNPYGGIMIQIPEDELPYNHRAGNLYKIEYDFKWYDQGIQSEEHHIRLARKLYEFMAPYVSSSPREAFYNYRDLDVGTNPPRRFAKTRAEFGEKYFGKNFRRLLKVKLEVDPGNFFRHEQSIPVIYNLI